MTRALLLAAALLWAADTAEQAARRQLATLESAGRGETLEASSAHLALAAELRLGSQPATAIEHAQRALEIREKLLSRDHADVAAALMEVGNTQSILGRYGEALKAFERALSIREKAFPARSLEIATTLSAIAAQCYFLGDLDRALRLNKRVLDIRTTLTGRDSLDVAQTLNDLGILYWKMKRYGEAAPRLERALAIREQKLDGADPLLAASLNNLAMVRKAASDLSAARDLYQRALAIREKSLGAEHPRLANGIGNLAVVLAEMGDYGRALELMHRALAIRAKALGETHPEVALTWVHIGTTNYMAGRRAEALEAALRAEDLSRRHLDHILRNAPERLGVLYSGARTGGVDLALSLAARRPTAEEVPKVYDCLIRSRALALDEMVLRRRGVRRPVAGFAELHLPADTALVSFARYEDSLEFPGTRKNSPNVHCYMAFVVNGEANTPVPVWLGKAGAIDALVEAWRREIAREAAAPGVASRRYERSLRQAGLALRRAVWDPVAPHLGRARNLILVPDGALHRVSFEALPQGAGYWAESGPVVRYLDTERDLVRPGPRSKGEGLLAVGGVSYSGGTSLDRLPASADEVHDVVAVWKRSRPASRIETLESARATIAAFERSAPGRAALHLATHGLFAREVPDSIAGKDALPAMRAALAMSGEGRGALLTADRISALNLEGVRWVVLSGCATALGGVHDHEGVFGLRRSFQLAGAEVVVASLWPVEDQSARQWMHAFYKALLETGATAPEAVRAANLEVLRSRRARGQSTHPFFWAGFAAFGLPQ